MRGQEIPDGLAKEHA